MLSKQQKLHIIDRVQIKAGDTGSAEVQVGLLTKGIEKLIEHLKINKKDRHSRLGLLKMVSQRKKFMNYLQKNKAESYLKVTKELNLKQ